MIALPERPVAARISTPIGRALVVAGPHGVSSLGFDTEATDVPLDPGALREVTETVLAYFDDPVALADLPLGAPVTGFAADVRRALLQVPAGSTTTYGEVARRVGRPGAARAVGRAVGANPVAIAVPCHRVVRSDGTIGGYAWGVERKRALLSLEQRHSHHNAGGPE